MPRWLAAARTGSQEALGQALEACRTYLLLVAERELAPELRAKGGASDLVQEVMVDAVRDFGRFQGGTEAELLAWLRRLLLNNLTDFTRRYRETDKRQLGREVPLRAGDSADPAGVEPSAGSASPSDRVVEAEQIQAIRRALASLPEDYRRVLRLRYQENLSFEEIGRLLGLSTNAACKLWRRAVKRVRQETGEEP
jgi:RNA polymerase sigma-70 factor (ECF subfamily)